MAILKVFIIWPPCGLIINESALIWGRLAINQKQNEMFLAKMAGRAKENRQDVIPIAELHYYSGLQGWFNLVNESSWCCLIVEEAAFQPKCAFCYVKICKWVALRGSAL
ncbi:hypothetical protein CBW55_19185 [Yersinia intermedia]|nr:hypothetical protein CBW55_19185 [Yersinia intermedia]